MEAVRLKFIGNFDRDLTHQLAMRMDPMNRSPLAKSPCQMQTYHARSADSVPCIMRPNAQRSMRVRRKCAILAMNRYVFAFALSKNENTMRFNLNNNTMEVCVCVFD